MRTLILSPDTIFAEALSHCLTRDQGIDTVGMVLDPATAEDAVKALHPSVLVCDQRSAGEGLSETLDRIHLETPGLRSVLVATMTGPSREQTAQFDAVVPPRSSLHRVIAAVREVAWYRGGRLDDEADRGLSQREIEVLRLLARGTGTRAMAAQMHLSPHTVRNHIRRLTAKLGVTSRLEAVTVARRLGVI